MNTYFPNPFLTPLQGDGQPNPGGLPCNFGGLTASRYGEAAPQSGGPAAGQGFLCSSNPAGMTGQYSTPSPNHHHMTAAGAQDPSCPRSASELNGYDGQTHGGHLGPTTPGWGSAGAGHHHHHHGGAGGGGGGGGGGPQHSPSDYSSSLPPNTTENLISGTCGTTQHQSYTTASQPIPFYPWMGVVGKPSFFLPSNPLNPSFLPSSSVSVCPSVSPSPPPVLL